MHQIDALHDWSAAAATATASVVGRSRRTSLGGRHARNICRYQNQVHSSLTLLNRNLKKDLMTSPRCAPWYSAFPFASCPWWIQSGSGSSRCRAWTSPKQVEPRHFVRGKFFYESDEFCLRHLSWREWIVGLFFPLIPSYLLWRTPSMMPDLDPTLW